MQFCNTELNLMVLTHRFLIFRYKCAFLLIYLSYSFFSLLTSCHGEPHIRSLLITALSIHHIDSEWTYQKLIELIDHLCPLKVSNSAFVQAALPNRAPCYTPAAPDLAWYSINTRANTNCKITGSTCVMYTKSGRRGGFTTRRITTRSHLAHGLKRSPALEIKEVTLISRRSTYIPSPSSTPPQPPRKSPLNTWSLLRWRPGGLDVNIPEREGEGGREAESSELLYQLDGRCYFLSRQPISIRSVKDGHRMAEVRHETAPDSIMSFGGSICA